VFDALAPHMPIALRAVVADRWLLEPLLVGGLEGLAAGNAIVRTTPSVIGPPSR
jgi:hypothetical protein